MCMIYNVCTGDSLDLFVSKAEAWFEVTLVEDYDEQVRYCSIRLGQGCIIVL